MESINVELSTNVADVELSTNAEDTNMSYKKSEIRIPVSMNTTILSLLTNPVYRNKMTKTIKDSEQYSADVITFYKKRTNTLFKDLYQTTKDIPTDLITLHKLFIQLSIKYFIIKDNEINDSINAQKVTDASQNIQDEIPIPQLKIINTVYPVPLEQSDQSEPLLSDKMKSNKSKSNQLKSNQIKSNQIKSNQINSNQLKSNKSKHPFIGFERIEVVKPLD